MCGSVRRRLPGMLNCHQKLGHTTTETPVTIPPIPGATTAEPAATQASSSSDSGGDEIRCNKDPGDASEPENDKQNRTILFSLLPS